MGDDKKTVRFHVLFDEKSKRLLDQAAHDSWMSAGQYMRELVELVGGAPYDTVADWVMIGREIGIEGFEVIRQAAERRGVKVNHFCAAIGQRKQADEATERPSSSGAEQVDLFS